MPYKWIIFVLLNLASTLEAECNSENKPPRTIIVGAGISGLSAALHLEENSVNDYLILEATDRIGGRIKTLIQEQDDIEYPLELGAGWIHGTEDNPVYDLAKYNDLFKENDWTRKHVNKRFSVAKREFRMADASVIPKKTWVPVYNVFSSTVKRGQSFYKEGLPDGYSINASVESFVLDQFNKAFEGSSHDNELWKKERSLVGNMLLFETLLSGCHSMKEVSLKYYGSYKRLEGDDTPLPGGYETVTNAMKQNISDSKIKFNRVVTKIEYSTNGSMVIVTCRNGETYEADHVIVTSSLGYLKEHTVAMFDPPLPESKMAAIRRMGFGTVDRIYLEFENLDFIQNQETGIVFFVHKHGELKDPTNWLQKVFICYVQDVPKANVLMCWLTGQEAEEMEGKPEDEISLKLWVLLQKYLGTNVTAPTKIIRSAWKSEEFTKGSYSYVKVGSSIDDIKNLAESIYFYHENYTKPIVMFAGEATHDEFYSTTHGAYLSGIREADKIIRSYRERSKMNKTVVIITVVLIFVVILLIAIGICVHHQNSGHRYSMAGRND